MNYFSTAGSALESSIPASLQSVYQVASPYMGALFLGVPAITGLIKGAREGYNRHQGLFGYVRSGIEDIVNYTGAGTLGAGLIGTIASIGAAGSLAAAVPAGLALAVAVLPYAAAAGAVYTVARGIGSVYRGIKNLVARRRQPAQASVRAAAVS
ncbi:hypothetical protein COY95_03085 [Candidatus Woesearchaeota archaeon CG_4_10_14_0_8_um_filter_47_5]|nr:MAG: hypothetical protein COY95_03085 [Candidatus Woesearchaeota archaeon CG_4_10_14_0_8_um_filter_47_5]